MMRARAWLWWLSLTIIWIIAYTYLPAPVDTWLLVVTVIVFGIWLYDRACGRFKLPPRTVRFKPVREITLTHILLALLLLAMLANHSELVKVQEKTIAVEDSVIDLQNAASGNTDEIKSSLDDVKDAVLTSAP